MNCFFGHHRSGSTYVKTIISNISYIQGTDIRTVHSTDQLSNDINPSWLVLTNANAEAIDKMTFNKGFHVIRDPRDVVVSSYFSHLHSHKTNEWPELVEHRKYLKSVDFNEGLLHEITDCRKTQFNELHNWSYDYPHILEVKFEDLILDPAKLWSQIFNHLEIEITSKSLFQFLLSNYNQGVGRIARKTKIKPIATLVLKNKLTQNNLNKIIFKNGYEKFSKRKKGKEDVHHHYRKGIAGDWKNQFTEKHKEIFKEKWGDLLIKLNYEEDYNW